MITADLPPNSRKTRLTVSLAAAMILRPTAVDPVKVTTSTSGLVVSASPDRGVRRAQHVDHAVGYIGVIGDQLTERQRDQRRVRRALEDHGASGGQRGGQLGQRQLVRVVVGDDRGDHPGGFLLHPAVMAHAPGFLLAEVFGELVAAKQVGVEAHDADRLVELGALGQRSGGADFGDGQLTQLFGVVDQRLMQLVEAADPQLDVGGPAGGVERTPGRRDRRVGLR